MGLDLLTCWLVVPTVPSDLRMCVHSPVQLGTGVTLQRPLTPVDSSLVSSARLLSCTTVPSSVQNAKLHRLLFIAVQGKHTTPSQDSMANNTYSGERLSSCCLVVCLCSWGAQKTNKQQQQKRILDGTKMKTFEWDWQRGYTPLLVNEPVHRKKKIDLLTFFIHINPSMFL